MTNSEIAKIFELTAKLITLHDDKELDPKPYDAIFKSLRRWDAKLKGMSKEDIANVGNIGLKSAEKVIEIVNSGTLSEFQNLKDKTPKGIIELLSMKGLGAKNLRKLWINLEITNAEDLLFACRKDKLLKLKGFGAKTQDNLKNRLMFFLSMRGYGLFSTVEKKALSLLSLLKEKYPNQKFELTGSIRRKEQILKKIDLLTTQEKVELDEVLSLTKGKHYYKDTLVVFHTTNNENWGSTLLNTTGPSSFVKQMGETDNYKEEIDIFKNKNINFIPSEIRHQTDIAIKAEKDDFSNLVTVEDIKGSLHMHTTDSDGLNSLEEMVKYADDVGYEYMLITDHSKSAGYANGLQIQRLLQQIDQIKSLNNQYRINVYAGIESDILKDGSLDYPDDILAQLDIVVASVHSGLIMDVQKATDRVLRAIENPYTRIMGHLTGRLLTVREGYPIDHKKIIDACAKTNTVMELNANPSRLDMDEQYIAYAMKKKVMISINPDAHSTSQLNMMRYGVNAARRGGLTKGFCLNTKDVEAFSKWVENDLVI